MTFSEAFGYGCLIIAAIFGIIDFIQYGGKGYFAG